MASIFVDGVESKALVDSGSTRSIISAKLVSNVNDSDTEIMAVNGKAISCEGTALVRLQISEWCIEHEFLVMKELIPGIPVILGLDVIDRFGGVSIGAGTVKFKKEKNDQQFEEVAMASCSSSKKEPIEINDPDFTGKFEGGKWTVAWRWKGDPPKLINRKANYGIPDTLSKAFDDEIQTWIKEGWLKPIPGGYQDGILPLIPVEQAEKGNVRPVLDFRHVNHHVVSHTAQAEVCDETIRRWRQWRGKIAMLDLRKAYLQIFVDPEFWKFQAIEHKGQCYYLTRLGFGLSSAPRIMSEILRTVLSLDPRIEQGTDHYIDDVIVNEDVISTDEVMAHLKRYGLESKPAQPLVSSKVLGLQLQGSEENLKWTRGKMLSIPAGVQEGGKVSRRELFSICGQIIGHYPVAGWMRVACGFVKRKSEGTSWDDDIGDQAKVLLCDLLARMGADNPVGGVWRPALDGHFRVWCDASSLAIGTVMEIGGCVMEDAAWLRKADDPAHINVAELEAVIRGINLAIKWKAVKLEVMTDSATVKSWLESVFSSSHRARAHGITEMLVRRRLNLLADLVSEYGLSPTVTLIPSSQNKADILTRVPRQWLKRQSGRTSEGCIRCYVGGGEEIT